MVEHGIIIGTEPFKSASLLAFAREVESMGYDSLWLPELFGREPVATAAYLLARTKTLKLATGIANVYVRDAHCMAQTRQTLAELSDGRFILGLGVSNVGLNSARGHQWLAPLAKMTAYLDDIAAAEVQSPAPATTGPLYIAAHGPRLQALGASRTDGVITYLMPPEHTRESRARIGPSAVLNAVCLLLLETDPARARTRIRAQLKYYLTLDYYHREWQKLGFTDADFADGGSDHLVDSMVGWGDAAALKKAVAAYQQAGADRVIVMPLDIDGSLETGMATLRALGP